MLQAMFSDIWFEKVMLKLVPIILVSMHDMGATERGREAYRKMREARFGKKLEDWCPDDQARTAFWSKVLDGLHQMSVWLDVNLDGSGEDAKGGQRKFVMGEELTWADVVVGGTLLFARRMMGDEATKELLSVDGGRWNRYFQAFEPFEYVDEEGVTSLKQWVH